MIRLFEHIRQQQPGYCGIAALAICAKQYGFQYNLQQLADRNGTDDSGTTLDQLCSAAETLPFSAQALELTFDQLRHLPLPMIAALRFNGPDHYIVVQKITTAGVVVSDPASHVSTWSRERLCRRWSGGGESGWGVALVPNLQLLPVGLRANGKLTIGRFLRLHHRSVWTLVSFALGDAILGLATIAMLRLLFQAIALNAQPQLDLAALALGLITVAQHPLRCSQEQCIKVFHRRLSSLFLANLRWETLQGTMTGSGIRESAKQCKNSRQIGNATAQLLRFVADTVVGLFLLVALWFISWPIALVATCIPVSGLFVTTLRKRSDLSTSAASSAGPQLATGIKLVVVALVWIGCKSGIAKDIELLHLLLGFIVVSQLRGVVSRLADVQANVSLANHALHDFVTWTIAKSTKVPQETAVEKQGDRLVTSNRSKVDQPPSDELLWEEV